MQAAVERLGFTREEFHQLRRISMTLHHWHELECGTGDDRVTRSVERDEATDKPFLRVQYATAKGWQDRRYPIPDRERGALKRLGKIIADRNTRNWVGSGVPIKESPGYLHSYVQGDPRGAALYLVTAEQLRGDSIDSCYSRGIAIY